MANRTPRAQSSREEEKRNETWKPASLLPTPEPRDGFVFRWVRTSMLGNSDAVNVSAKFREGWEPVPASEFQELKVMSDIGSKFPENIEVGGLILCQAPQRLMEQRREYYARMAGDQMKAVDQSYMKENDPRMPLLAPERQSRVSRFGNG